MKGLVFMETHLQDIALKGKKQEQLIDDLVQPACSGTMEITVKQRVGLCYTIVWISDETPV
jgi:hypothetical protein